MSSLRSFAASYIGFKSKNIEFSMGNSMFLPLRPLSRASDRVVHYIVIFSSETLFFLQSPKKNSKTHAKINSSVKQYFGSHPADLFQKKVFYNISMYDPKGGKNIYYAI